MCDSTTGLSTPASTELFRRTSYPLSRWVSLVEVQAEIVVAADRPLGVQPLDIDVGQLDLAADLDVLDLGVLAAHADLQRVLVGVVADQHEVHVGRRARVGRDAEPRDCAGNDLDETARFRAADVLVAGGEALEIVRQRLVLVGRPDQVRAVRVVCRHHRVPLDGSAAAAGVRALRRDQRGEPRQLAVDLVQAQVDRLQVLGVQLVRLDDVPHDRRQRNWDLVGPGFVVPSVEEHQEGCTAAVIAAAHDDLPDGVPACGIDQRRTVTGRHLVAVLLALAEMPLGEVPVTPPVEHRLDGAGGVDPVHPARDVIEIVLLDSAGRRVDQDHLLRNRCVAVDRQLVDAGGVVGVPVVVDLERDVAELVVGVAIQPQVASEIVVPPAVGVVEHVIAPLDLGVDARVLGIDDDETRADALDAVAVALAIGHQVVQPVQMPVDGLQSPLVGLVGRGQLRIPVEGLAGFEVGRLFRHQQHVVRIGIRIAAGLLERDRHLVGEGLGVVIAADISAGIEASEDRHADHQKDGKAGSSSELTGPNA